MGRNTHIGTGDSIQVEGCFSPSDGEHSSIKWNEQYFHSKTEGNWFILD